MNQTTQFIIVFLLDVFVGWAIYSKIAIFSLQMFLRVIIKEEDGKDFKEKRLSFKERLDAAMEREKANLN